MRVQDCDVVSVNLHKYDFMCVNSRKQDIVSIVIQYFPRLVRPYGDWHERTLVPNLATYADAVRSHVLQIAVRRV